MRDSLDGRLGVTTNDNTTQTIDTWQTIERWQLDDKRQMTIRLKRRWTHKDEDGKIVACKPRNIVNM